MKTLIFSLLFTIVTNVILFGQTINVDFDKIKSLTTPNKTDPLTFTEEEKLDYKIIFSNVNQANKSVFDACTFNFGDKPKVIASDFSAKHDSTNNTYTLDLSTALLNLTPEDSPTFFNIQYKGKKIYSFDIRINKKSPQNISELTQTQIQMEIDKFFKRALIPKLKKEIGLKENKNALVDENDVIHLFVDVYGKFYGAGVPTAAQEKNRFQFHILLNNQQVKEYIFEELYAGEYKPQILNILNTKTGAALNSGSIDQETIEISVLDGAIKGPYTDLFSAEINRFNNDGKNKRNLVDAEIRIAKLYHVSISTGLLSTTLRNPQNIEMMPLPNGDSTLVANDPRTRGALTIMATFYPKGRSFLFPPEGGLFNMSRFGIQVGTQLNDKIAENFFLGLSHDFARGGAISYGAHYGRRNFVAGDKDFNFGKDKIDLPELIEKKEWNIGFYFGVVIDTRIALELIKSLGSNQ